MQHADRDEGSSRVFVFVGIGLAIFGALLVAMFVAVGLVGYLGVQGARQDAQAQVLELQAIKLLSAAQIAKLRAGALAPCGSEATATAAARRDGGAPHDAREDPVERCLLDLGASAESLSGRFWIETPGDEVVVHGIAEIGGELVHVRTDAL